MIGGRVRVGNRCPWTRGNIGPHRGMQTVGLIRYGSSLGDRLTGYENLYSSQPYMKDRRNTLSFTTREFGIKCITSVLRCGWLRWYDHAQRTTSCIKSITNLRIPGTKKKGRRWKTWSECVNCEDWCQWVWPSWRCPTKQRCMESQCFDIAWCC